MMKKCEEEKELYKEKCIFISKVNFVAYFLEQTSCRTNKIIASIRKESLYYMEVIIG